VASTVLWLLFGGDFGYCGSRKIRQEGRTFGGKPELSRWQKQKVNFQIQFWGGG